MKRTLSVLLFVGLGLAACGDKKASPADGRLHVAYVTNGPDPFWNIAKAGALKAGRDLGLRVSVEMPSPNGGIVEQKRILEDLLTRGIDGLAVSPIDHVNQTPFLNRVAAKVPLITSDSDAPESKRRCFIGVANYAAGRMAGELAREALPDGGKVMIFIGRLEQDNARARAQGTIDALLGRSPDPTRHDPADTELKAGKIVILGTRTDQFDRSTAKANAADALTAHPDLACMVGLFAYNPPAILEALRQAGKLAKVKVVGFDEDDATLQAIKDGNCVATVVQDPFQYGYKSIEVLKAILTDEDAGIPASGIIDVPARIIGPAEVDAFWADKKRKIAAGSDGR